jgi:purine-binding chemotaxis protein CheW
MLNQYDRSARGNGEIHLTDEQRLHEVLMERARQLAIIGVEKRQDAEIALLVFLLESEQYGIPLAALRSIQPARGLTPVPRTPPRIAGVLNVRGEIVAVVDLAVVLGLRTASMPEHPQVVLVDGPDGQVGLLVDEILGVRSIPMTDIEPSLTGMSTSLGIGDRSVGLLNLEYLLADERLAVDDVG